jgi:hypothetical protein
MKNLFATFVGILFVALAFSVQTARAQEDVGRLVEQLEEHSDKFVKSLNTALDGSQYNGTSSEDEINGYVKRFEDATDKLKNNWEDNKNNKVAATEVLERARTIDTFLKNHAMGDVVTTDWNTIRSDLERIAKAYKLKMGM